MKCGAEITASMRYLRRRRRTGLQGCVTCVKNDRASRALAPQQAVVKTTLTRQGIHARVARGWTWDEARELPRGQTPPRLRERYWLIDR